MFDGRATIADGKDFSNNIYLTDSAAVRAEAELLGQVQVVALRGLKINQKVVVLASDYTLLGPGPPPQQMGHMRVLSQEYFRALRPGKAPLTPSNMGRKPWGAALN